MPRLGGCPGGVPPPARLGGGLRPPARASCAQGHEGDRRSLGTDPSAIRPRPNFGDLAHPNFTDLARPNFGDLARSKIDQTSPKNLCNLKRIHARIALSALNGYVLIRQK